MGDRAGSSSLELDLNPFHRLGEVVPDERRQFFGIFGHSPHRHSLGAMADGFEIGRRNALQPFGQQFYRQPLDQAGRRPGASSSKR